MTKGTLLHRICTACGLSKPLSAFLYISSTRGTTYGAVCAACRGSEIARKKQALSDEDAGSAKSELHIRAKEKMHFEKEWERKFKEKKQNDILDRKKKEHARTFKTEEAEHHHLEEKRHHPKESIEKFERKEEPNTSSQPSTPEKPERASDHQTLKEEAKQKDIKDQKFAGTLTNIDSQQTTVARHISDVHKGFLEFLGESAAAASQMIKSRRARTHTQQMFTNQKENKNAPKTHESSPPDFKPEFQKKK